MTRWHTVISTADRFCSPLAWVWQHRLWSSNHTITRLSSWFGIHGSVLCWFKSYLPSRSFRVTCKNNLLSFHTSSCCVPKALFLAHYSSSCNYPSQHSDLFPFPWPPPLCIWHSALLLFPPTLIQAFLTFKKLFNRSVPGWLLIFLLLTPLRLNQTQKPTCQNTQLFTWHLPLCSKSWLHLWWTSYPLWPNYISSKACYYHIPQLCCIWRYLNFDNCLYHCYL